MRGLVLCFVAVLASCEKPPPPFTREGGVWRYRGAAIAGADAASFSPLSDHYAKDRHRVYYADTYRDGTEYYSVAHARITVIEGADAATFRYIDRGYARDRTHVYDEGERRVVHDAASFTLLDYAFARDNAGAYCHVTPIAGSDAASFVVLDSHYAKDRARVYWCSIESDGGARRPYVRIVVVDADAATFTVSDTVGGDADAKDARGAFKRSERVR
jgi:hypothetical protein